MLMQTHEARLDALRKELARRGLDGFVVPIADEHMGEYVRRHAQRLGVADRLRRLGRPAIVLTDKAAIFIDGRYTVAVRAQVDSEAFECQPDPADQPDRMGRRERSEGGKLGFDPWLQTVGHDAVRQGGEARPGAASSPSTEPDRRGVDRPARALARSGRRRSPTSSPARPRASAAAQSPTSSQARALRRGGADRARFDRLAAQRARRRRRPHAVRARLRAAARRRPVDLFMDRRQGAGAHRTMLGNAVTIARGASSSDALGKLAGSASRSIPTSASRRSSTRSPRRAPSRSPCATPIRWRCPRRCKNPLELKGIRAAHRRDGAAEAKFLRWLEAQRRRATIREIEASDRLQAFRQETGQLRDLSFDTISGAGPNGAIVHYHATQRPSDLRRAGLALSRRFRRPVPRRHAPTSPAPWRSARRRRR